MPITVLARILSESIVALRDGHARLELDSLTTAVLASAMVLPLRVSIEDGKLIVLYNDSPTDTTQAGDGNHQYQRALFGRVDTEHVTGRLRGRVHRNGENRASCPRIRDALLAAV
jgi:hypothetical protein